MKPLELRPDRRLLKSNFDGYKLSLDPTPVLRMEIADQNHPHRVRPNEQQYTYFHARLFGMQNHLVRDPWDTGRCYYVDAHGMVQRVQYDETLGRTKPLCAVFKMPLTVDSEEQNLDHPEGNENTAEKYNCSMVFPSEQYCLLSDGNGVIRVLETGDRASGQDWKARSVFRPAKNDDGINIPDGGFTLLDARFLVQGGNKLLDCILMQIEHQPERQSETLLYWFTLQQQQLQQPNEKNQEWVFRSSRVLRGGGFPRYCSLDYRAAAVLLASDKPFRFTYDSEHPVEVDHTPSEKETYTEKPQAYEQYPFEWRQTMSEVNIKFACRTDVQYHVVPDSASDRFQVLANDTVVIEGADLFAKIDHECTVWTIDRKALEITLPKQTTGVMWPFLFPGGPNETIEASGDVTQKVDLPPAPSLNAPLEECDFGDAGESDKFYSLERLSRESHQVTHYISLGSVPPLFSITLRAGLPDAIVLRHDVDACLWQLQPPASPDACQLQHEGTLHAFGYVQASKRQQKFLACAPDFGYAVICESERRLFIYRSNYGINGAGLRHRAGLQVSLGQQRLVTLDDASEILGICCEREVILVLTENALLTLQLGIEE